MKPIFYLLSVLTILSCNDKPKNAPIESKSDQIDGSQFYIGTYTSDKPYNQGGSKGIYTSSINNEGILTEPILIIESDQPSYMVKANDNRHLLVVNEINTNSGNGTVESYEILKDNTLSKISTSSSGGAHPCHVTVNNQGQVTVANYSGGNIGLLNINKDGRLSALLDTQNHEGKGSTDRQDAPHAHSSWFRPDGKGLISVDLGTNELWFSEIKDNKLNLSQPSKLAMEEGAGPRHLAFHSTNDNIYILNELNNTVSLCQMDNNKLTLKKSFSMLPETFKEYSNGADIHISNDGNFLYASNRGHNSIAVFSIDPDSGHLTNIERQSTRGDGPRNFRITPDGKFLVVANQLSNNIISYKRDSKTGKLEFVSEIFAPTPVCLLF